MERECRAEGVTSAKQQMQRDEAAQPSPGVPAYGDNFSDKLPHCSPFQQKFSTADRMEHMKESEKQLESDAGEPLIQGLEW